MIDEIRKIAQAIEDGQNSTAKQRTKLERYLINLQDQRDYTLECIEYYKSTNNTSEIQREEQELKRIDSEIQRIDNLLKDNYKNDSELTTKDFTNNLYEVLSHNIEIASYKYGIENAIDYYDLNATRIEILDAKTLKEYNLSQYDANSIYDNVLYKIRKRYAKEIQIEKQRVKYLTKKRDFTRTMVVGSIIGLNLLQKKINKGAGIK